MNRPLRRAAPPPGSGAAELVAQAGRALSAGDAAQARRLAAAATALDPTSPTGWHLQAVAHHHLGEPQEARRSILRCLRARPAYPEAWNTLGNLAGAEGDSATACDAYRASIALAPDFPDPYNNLGAQNEEGDGALPLFRQALRLAPGFLNALLNAAAHAPAEQAITLYRSALTIVPDFAPAWNGLGLALRRPDDTAAPLACLRRAHRLDPARSGYLINFGNAAVGAKDDALAIAAWGRAVLQEPGSSAALMGLGLQQEEPLDTAVWLVRSLIVENQSLDCWLAAATAFRHAKKAPQAIEASRMAAILSPGDERCWWQLSHAADLQKSARDLRLRALLIRTVLAPSSETAYIQLAQTYNQMSRQDLALASIHTALTLKPDSAPAWDLLTTSRRLLSMLEEALVAASATLALAPGITTALVHYGIVLYLLGLPGAEIWYERAERAGGTGDCHVDWNRSLLFLAQGNLQEGWKRYDAGLPANTRRGGRDYETPRWQGEDISDKSIMVWREQGVGDELVFASCFPDIIARSARCIIECDPRLYSLFARSFPKAEVRPDSKNRDGDPEDFDVNVPAGSLPIFYRPTLDSFPPRRSFLRPDPQRVQFWRQRFSAISGGRPVVGICWRGRLKWVSRMPLYAQLREWGPILSQPDVTFVNLQYAQPEEEIEEAERLFGCKIHTWPDIDLMNDFDDVAAFGCALDLAITADTAAGALMGALGVPTWRYVTRGDYMSLGTERFPWMPSIRVYFREHDQQWPMVTQRIGNDLATEKNTLIDAAEQLRAGLASDDITANYEPQLGYLIKSAIEMLQQGKPDAATALFQKTLSYEPSECLSLQLLGTIALRRGDLAQAELLLRRAVRVRPDYVPAYVQLAAALRHVGRFKEAVQALRHALAWDPVHPEAFSNCGECLAMLGDSEGARRLLERVTLLRPALAEMEVNLGNLRTRVGDFRGAVAHYRRAITLKPGYLEAYLNLGAAQSELGDVARAEQGYRRALLIDPGNVVALGNCGDLLRMRGQFQAAFELFEQALRGDASTPEAQFVFALVALEAGHLDRGWPAYRLGLRSGQRGQPRELPVPAWDGAPLAGRSLLIWREQGVGDEIAFASVYPDLIRSAGRVTLECDPRLLSLFTRSFPGAKVRADTSRNPAPDLADIDLHAPAGDAASYLRRQVADFAAAPPAYLMADSRRAPRWRQRLADLGPGAKIGICWRSIRRSERRDLHYATPADLGSILRLPGVHFVNLQYGTDAAEQAELARHGVPVTRWSDLDLRNDFEGMSALLAELDAVVGPETTMTALAAALGRPTFIFLHASWLTLGTDRLPWLPSAHLFRRASLDWSDALTGLAAGLDRHLRDVGAAFDLQGALHAGVQQHRRGDLAAAESTYRRALAAAEDDADAHQLLGVLHLQRNEPEPARRHLEIALTVDPAVSQALTNLARLNDIAGRTALAERQYRRALQLDPAALEANLNLGALLVRQGRATESGDFSRRALTLSPAHAPLWSNLGDTYSLTRDYERARLAFQRTLRVNPAYAQAHANLGKAALAAGDLHDARRQAEAALSLAPESWHGLNLLGMTNALLDQSSAAELSYRRAVRAGGDAAVTWNLALLELQRGDLEAGWRDYEAGLQSGARRLAPMDRPPAWRGPGAAGRLLVRREQGVGDELLFATCFPDLLKVAPDCVIECDRRLVSLLARSFPTARFIPDGEVAGSDCLWQIAAGSLPRFFRRQLSEFPPSAHVLQADPGRVANWQERLAKLGTRPKIGVCWRSAVVSTVRSLYYAAIEDLEPVLTLADVDIICLQHDVTEAERRLVRERFGIELHLWEDFDLRDDLDGLAALLASLDVVIAPDTAVGAMAATVGAPLWKFTSRSAWTMHGTEREPWFPEARLFAKRPEAGWQPVFAGMAAEVAERLKASRRSRFTAALAALNAGDAGEAERLLRATLAENPRAADALAELSNLVRARGEVAQSLALIDAALCVDPSHARALTYLGLLFKDAENFAAALTCHQRAIVVDAELADGWINLANSWEQLGALPAALQAAGGVITLEPANPVAWTNFGGLLSAIGITEAARQCYRRLDQICPGSAVARWNLGLIDLSAGRLDAGWAGFRARFDANPQMPVRHRELPRWQGEDLTGHGIVVWSEQGIGDELVFASCLPELVAHAGRSVIECDPRLVSLWQRAFPAAEVRPLGSPADLEGIRFQAPTGDVAAWLRRSPERFPTQAAFLAADARLVGICRDRLAALGDRRKVGICWRGLRRNANRRAAYTALGQWGDVFAKSDVDFVSLQYGDAEEEIVAAEQQFGVRLHRWADLDLRDDFEAVAALMTGLDLVIGPDTAATALAGALGRPVWKLTPANDWMRLGSPHYPWLPSVRIFEKAPGGWSDTLADIAKLLRDLP